MTFPRNAEHRGRLFATAESPVERQNEPARRGPGDALRVQNRGGGLANEKVGGRQGHGPDYEGPG